MDGRPTNNRCSPHAAYKFIVLTDAVVLVMLIPNISESNVRHGECHLCHPAAEVRRRSLINVSSVSFVIRYKALRS